MEGTVHMLGMAVGKPGRLRDTGEVVVASTLWMTPVWSISRPCRPMPARRKGQGGGKRRSSWGAMGSGALMGDPFWDGMGKEGGKVPDGL